LFLKSLHFSSTSPMQFPIAVFLILGYL
jgi:hypothetical protein